MAMIIEMREATRQMRHVCAKLLLADVRNQ